MKKRKTVSFDEEEQHILQQAAGLLDLLAKKGVLEDHQISDERIRQAKKSTAKKAYHNTEVLLDQYRTIVWVLECAPMEIAHELAVQTKGFDALVAKLDYEINIDNKRMEGKVQTLIKTRLLIERVNDAMTVLKMKPGDGEELYRLIYDAHIDPVERDCYTLMERMNVSERTYYRMKREALSVLSMRLWSAPTADVDDWLEILTLLENM